MYSVGSSVVEGELNNPVPEIHLNSYKWPTSLFESWKTAAVSSVSSDNIHSEFNNEILTETEE